MSATDTSHSSKPRRGRPPTLTPEEKAAKWNDYIKNVYNVKNKEKCTQQQKERYEKNKDAINARRRALRAQKKKEALDVVVSEEESE